MHAMHESVPPKVMRRNAISKKQPVQDGTIAWIIPIEHLQFNSRLQSR